MEVSQLQWSRRWSVLLKNPGWLQVFYVVDFIMIHHKRNIKKSYHMVIDFVKPTNTKLWYQKNGSIHILFNQNLKICCFLPWNSDLQKLKISKTPNGKPWKTHVTETLKKPQELLEECRAERKTQFELFQREAFQGTWCWCETKGLKALVNVHRVCDWPYR